MARYACMCHVKNKYFWNYSWLLLHDNAPSFPIECEAVSCFQIVVCYSASPLLTRFGTRRLPPTKEKLFLKGQCFSNISDVQRDVTELLKVVSLQDFQCAFKDLYECSRHCMELGAIILQVCNKNFCIFIYFFHNAVSSLNWAHCVYSVSSSLRFRSSVVYMTFL